MSVASGQSDVRRALTYRPLLRRWFGTRLAWVTNTTARRWRLRVWHNPTWTKVRIGSRRHCIQFNSVYMYGRVCRRVAADSRARNALRGV